MTGYKPKFITLITGDLSGECNQYVQPESGLHVELIGQRIYRLCLNTPDHL